MFLAVKAAIFTCRAVVCISVSKGATISVVNGVYPCLSVSHHVSNGRGQLHVACDRDGLSVAN